MREEVRGGGERGAPRRRRPASRSSRRARTRRRRAAARADRRATSSARLDHRQQDPQLACRAPAPTIARSCASSASGRGEQQLEPALARAGEEGRRLVAAEVEHAHGRGAAARGPASTGASAARCSASVGHVVAPRGRRARCAAARRPRRPRRGRRRAPRASAALTSTRTRVPVERDGGQRRGRRAPARARPAGVLGGRGGAARAAAAGDEHHAPGVAVDDHRLAVAGVEQQLRRRARPQRDARARARRSRRARSAPPAASAIPATSGAELGDVGRAEIVGDEDGVRSAGSSGRGSPSAPAMPRGAPPEQRTSSARAASIASSSAAIAAAWRVGGGLERGRRRAARSSTSRLDVVRERRVARHQRAGARRSRPRRAAVAQPLGERLELRGRGASSAAWRALELSRAPLLRHRLARDRRAAAARARRRPPGPARRGRPRRLALGHQPARDGRAPSARMISAAEVAPGS